MRSLMLLLFALAAAVLTACGSSGSGAASDAASLAPADAIVYAEATIDPDEEQQQEIERLVAKFPGGKGAAIEELIEDALRSSDAPITWDEDVKPWLGDDVALFVSGRLGPNEEPEEVAAVIATDDEDASMDAVEKAGEGDLKDASYKDHEYKRGDDGAAGIVDGWLVVGTERGYKAAVDASEADGLEGSERYQRALEDAADERLGLAYFDTKAFLELAGEQSGGELLGGFQDLLDDPYVVTFDADADGADLRSSLPDATFGDLPFFGQGTDLVTAAPADSWFVLGQPQLGETLETYVDLIAQQLGGREQLERQLKAATGLSLDELLSWMGDFAVFVKGEGLSQLQGALVIETSDEAASKRTLAALRRIARNAGDVRVRPLAVEGEGFTLSGRGVPQGVHVFQRDGKVVAAYGDEAAREAIESPDALGDSQQFKDAAAALGEGYQPSVWLAFEPLLELVDSTPVAGDPDWRSLRPYLEPLGALVAASRREGDRLDTAVRITVP